MSVAVKPNSQSLSQVGYPTASTAFHWIVTAIAVWTLSGVYIDGWAHSHGMVDNTFFTLWHANLYSGVLAMLAFIGINQLLNMRRGYDIYHALPEGYLLTLIGAALFIAGGGFDFIWHSIFGFEVNFELLMSPAHLWLAISMVLMQAGIARSAWVRLAPAAARGWKTLGPLIISAMLILSMVIFFTMYAHPVHEVYASGSQTSQPTVDASQYQDLYVVNSENGQETKLTSSDDAFASFGAFSPDGSQIYYTTGKIGNAGSEEHESALAVMNVDGSNAHTLFDLPGEEFMQAVSPDGKRLAFVHVQHEDDYTLCVSDLDGSNLVELAPGGFGAAWSPDGQHIAFAAQPEKDGDTQIFITRPDGTDRVQLTDSKGDYKYGPDWSPNGKQIAFTLGDNVLGETIVTVDVASHQQTRLTDAAGFEAEPVWSHNGKQILYRRFDGNVGNLWIMNADGSDSHSLTYNHTLFIYALHWSPDGKQVLYTGQPVETDTGHLDYTEKSIGVASIILQSIFLMAALAVLTFRWNLPFGALTLMVGVTTALITIMDDTYQFIPLGIAAGLLADGLYSALGKPITEPRKQALFAFAVPFIYYAVYFLTVQLTGGIGWTVAVWAGAIVLAGLAGYLVSFAATVLRGDAPPREAA